MEKRFRAEDPVMVFLSQKGNTSIDIVDTHRDDGEVYITVTSYDYDALTETVDLLLNKLNA